ncbi:hypothetical protein FOZ76_07030 [Verticiella sediminum]|uniref:Pilus assembly protein PilP n=1 Tax=Verticiella sediminum TaxID=1247510 RepID=A0A556AVY3_9BURK|nr:hypothetical protein [Verticiella sediminum]TSH97070.1 hypothetical protein FOZ76_07030 [Verticiella sediminum]
MKRNSMIDLTKAARLVLAGVGFLAAPAAWAHGQAAWHAEAQTVQALLQAERDRLPGAPHAHAGSAAQQAPARVLPGETLTLVELYGVGTQLTAVVLVDGVRKEYRPGASLPYGGRGASEYRLLGIVQGCALLRRGAGAVRTVCHRPAPAAPVVDVHARDVLGAALPRAE